MHKTFSNLKGFLFGDFYSTVEREELYLFEPNFSAFHFFDNGSFFAYGHMRSGDGNGYGCGLCEGDGRQTENNFSLCDYGDF